MQHAEAFEDRADAGRRPSASASGPSWSGASSSTAATVLRSTSPGGR